MPEIIYININPRKNKYDLALRKSESILSIYFILSILTGRILDKIHVAENHGIQSSAKSGVKITKMNESGSLFTYDTEKKTLIKQITLGETYLRFRK